ncbi:hypothetical protein SmJEL517_g01195 [Synchytrium microbalum]|uniref:Uncharacterized protein n=1 Tax=Synchytrium microbalum TaxID=1806994 RepID=A0A507CBY3_9FUNG|nr:uncharacterized protein SmJEL517_g01195 [Synchytrium microbalum]TPX36679.1 hypothetical protein SmJEL517_g01195 [Synchytrium microbalum]
MERDQDKKKANPVIGASILGLKAEVARKKEEAEKRKASGDPLQITSTKTFKKPKLQNKGVEARAAKDAAPENKPDIYDRPEIADERVFLELKRKAELYDLKKRLGDGDDVDEEGRNIPDEELVDYLQKKHDEESKEASQRDSALASLENSDWVEFIDEFQRKRLVRKSQLPSMGLKFVKGTGVVDSGYTVGPELVSQDMLREQERLEWESEHREDAQASSSNTQEQLPFFNYKRENRQMGVGFYAFSQDETERRKQQDELRQLRVNTEIAQKVAAAMKNSRETRVDDRRKMIGERAKRRERMRQGGGEMVDRRDYGGGEEQELLEEGEDLLDLVKKIRSKFD